MNRFLLVTSVVLAAGAAVVLLGVIGIAGVIEYDERYGIFNFEEPDPLEG